MSKVVVQMYLTLDGVYQAPGDANEDTEGGFKHGGWQMGYWDADAGKLMLTELAKTEALLLGRKTYEIFAAYWPTAKSDPVVVAEKFNAVPKYVASRTLTKADWKGTKLFSSNLAREVANARQEAGSGVVAVIGSGNLVQSLMKENLVDEYHLWIHPLVLGSGKRLFDGGVIPTHLKLIDTKGTEAGILILTLVPEKK